MLGDMPRVLPDFDALWNAYPSGLAADVKREIGGNVDADWISNTCTIRISRCFNRAGAPIPGGLDYLNTVRGGDGMRYAFRVREFSRYLERVYGAPSVTHEYPDADHGHAPPAAIEGKRGLIRFDVEGWRDATGHLDLWNGAECVNHGYFARSWRVSLWEASDVTTASRLSGSVGRGGVNRPDDVRMVQVLLSRAGLAVGAIDGMCGDRTIGAIETFQDRFASQPDGRVDVLGRTWRQLLDLD